ncbi:hypothetical protein MTO96_028654, partial [Rhipicephalus appendiculatus]
GTPRSLRWCTCTSFARCTRKGPGAVRANHVKIAIRNLSMAIDKGDIFGLLGPNGAGKTSTMKVIVGEESPSSGRVKYLEVFYLRRTPHKHITSMNHSLIE